MAYGVQKPPGFFWREMQGHTECHHGQCVIDCIQRYSRIKIACLLEFDGTIGHDAFLDFLCLNPEQDAAAHLFQSVAPAEPVYATDEGIIHKCECPANPPLDIRKCFNICQSLFYGSVNQADVFVEIDNILVFIPGHGFSELNLGENQYPPKGP